MYGAFANVYDRLMRDVDYEAWARHYARLLALRGVTDGALCECACGTGALTLPLARMGFRVTGVDASPDMLAVAVQKAARQGLSGKVAFVCQDMQKLSLHKRQRAVLCTCDGVNYLVTPERARRFFHAAADTLLPGGVLALDVSTPEKLEKTLGDNTLGQIEDDLCLHWENAWRATQKTVDMRLAIFVRNTDGSYARIDETQTQRAHGQDELTDWLSDAGFEDIRFFGDMRETPPRAGDQRWHITCVRRQYVLS